jgi:hypothetical protein
VAVMSYLIGSRRDPAIFDEARLLVQERQT